MRLSHASERSPIYLPSMATTEMARKPETMGRRLASARAFCDLSQEEAASRVGFAQSYLSRLEADKAQSPPINTIKKLAELYGVSIDYLVNGAAAQ